MYIGVHVKYHLSLPDFNKTFIFTTYLRKINQYQFSWISVHWEPSCFMQTGKTDRERERYDEAKNSISKFCESVYLRK